jgi:hypothetical protein
MPARKARIIGKRGEEGIPRREDNEGKEGIELGWREYSRR